MKRLSSTKFQNVYRSTTFMFMIFFHTRPLENLKNRFQTICTSGLFSKKTTGTNLFLLEVS
jgi:hypothetical protein